MAPTNPVQIARTQCSRLGRLAQQQEQLLQSVLCRRARRRISRLGLQEIGHLRADPAASAHGNQAAASRQQIRGAPNRPPANEVHGERAVHESNTSQEKGYDVNICLCSTHNNDIALQKHAQRLPSNHATGGFDAPLQDEGGSAAPSSL